MRFLRAALLLTCSSTVLAAQVTQAEYQARRAALVDALPGDGVLVVLGAAEPSQNHETFWQSQNFRYLTGFLEPDAALVVVKRSGASQALLFVPPKDPAQEVWTGERLGVDGAKARTGLDARDAGTLRVVLDSLLAGGGALFAAGDFSRGGGADVPGALVIRTAHDQFLDALKGRHREVKVSDVNDLVMRQRGRKSAAELALIRDAAAISAAAHREAMRAIEPGMNEFEIQAIAEYTFRRNGGDRPSYGSIVGSGPNSTVLHYNRDDRFLRDGEVVTMDMATYYAGYSADITRTVPVNGKFSPAQRDVYSVVLAAQGAAERQIRAGVPFAVLNDSALSVIKTGLTRLGLIEAPDATYDCGAAARNGRCPQYRLYYMHGLGHPLGLDVHDADVYTRGVLAVGSVFTIEPGIYVRGNTVDIIPDVPSNAALRRRLAPVVARYANIGVRIEDDYEVTDAGFERISAGVPREMDAIEREMAMPAGPAPRDAARVESYRRLKP
jgi:Xaa-Pro aminopeptidase